MTARHHIANGLPAQHRPFAITGPIRPNLAQLQSVVGSDTLSPQQPIAGRGDRKRHLKWRVILDKTSASLDRKALNLSAAFRVFSPTDGVVLFGVATYLT